MVTQSRVSAILAGPTPDLEFAAVRLPAELAALAPTIVNQFESDTGAKGR